jgi:hypothetical protein
LNGTETVYRRARFSPARVFDKCGKLRAWPPMDRLRC